VTAVYACFVSPRQVMLLREIFIAELSCMKPLVILLSLNYKYL